MENVSKRLVIIDDNFSTGDKILQFAESLDFVAALIPSADEAIKFIEDEGAEFLLANYDLLGLTGIRTAELLRQNSWNGQIILMTKDLTTVELNRIRATRVKSVALKTKNLVEVKLALKSFQAGKN